jgi:hypothetical protein
MYCGIMKTKEKKRGALVEIDPAGISTLIRAHKEHEEAARKTADNMAEVLFIRYRSSAESKVFYKIFDRFLVNSATKNTTPITPLDLLGYAVYQDVVTEFTPALKNLSSFGLIRYTEPFRPFGPNESFRHGEIKLTELGMDVGFRLKDYISSAKTTERLIRRA